eukprot:359841-Chlamydomonas_euryale.AAC.11
MPHKPQQAAWHPARHVEEVEVLHGAAAHERRAVAAVPLAHPWLPVKLLELAIDELLERHGRKLVVSRAAPTLLVHAQSPVVWISARATALLEVAQHPHMPERGEMRQPNPGEAFIGSNTHGTRGPSVKNRCTPWALARLQLRLPQQRNDVVQTQS